VKVGLIARAEDRGLGIQTWEFHRHMAPDRTLLVDMGDLARGFAMHPERYPDATVAPFANGQLPQRLVRDWLAGLDVVFTAETLYDWRLADWARAAGCATVVQVNPEFYRHATDPLPHPTVWWAPSPWRIATLPAENTRLVPVPVAADRFAMRVPERADRLRVLHVAGHRAAGDRNGTLQLLQSLRYVRQPMVLRLLTQDSRLPRTRPGGHVEVHAEAGGRPNYWDLYADADVLALPRRYGGLCLPVQEAMASGLAVVMTDTAPNDWWPTLRVQCRAHSSLNTATGKVPMMAADPRDLGRQLDRLAQVPELLLDLQEQALRWAEDHSWQALRPRYIAELERAAELA
jgi:hypothetical protein